MPENDVSIKKKQLGQYFTESNPFHFDLFQKWAKCIEEDDVILEPFAGICSIVKLMREVGFNNEWKCYDIDDTQKSIVDGVEVLLRDTIEDFPESFRVCVTNPPYLSRVSASRMKLAYPKTEYADLYMHCLSLILDHCEYCAAIIPESFITQDLFIDRLYGVISLNIKMFSETDCPVCLAMFSPSEECDCTQVYVGNEYLGTLCDLSEYRLDEYNKYYNGWTFNSKTGELGVKCVDSNTSADISFFHGDKIDPDDIKVSSRAYTRISGLPSNIELDHFIERCNRELKIYRDRTKDVFLTSFKGLRNDSRYRRRIDFYTLKSIMNKVLFQIYNKDKQLELF